MHLYARPHVTVEGSTALPVPIKITTYKDTTPTTVLLAQKQKNWSRFQKPVPSESTNRGTKICQWYRRRRALRELIKLTRLEQKRLENLQLEKARRKREAEVLELFQQREKEIRYAEQQLEKTPQIVYSKKQKKKQAKDTKKKLPKAKPKSKSSTDDTQLSGFQNKKKKRQKVKSTEAKPVAASRYVATKTVKHQKDSVNERFTNFCYRICCQCYCCVTFIMIIGVLIIFLF